MNIETRVFQKPALPEAELPLFWQVRYPPETLFIEGKSEAFHLLERLPEDGFGIVGTRRPQPRTRSLIREIVRDLQDFPLILISGLALGTDAEAHEAALEFNLPTIAVLGTGLEETYPREHQELRKKILQAGGLIITEFENGTGPLPWHFIQRNRLIAGWSKACWIAEAPHRSGALNTAKWARESDRVCYATPCFPGDAAFAGNEKLLDVFEARALLNVRSLGDTWSELTAARSHSKKSNSSQSTLPLSDDRVLAAEIHQRSATSGGASVQETLDAALARGWTPPRFFVALQGALRRGLIREKDGIYMSR